jgi:hypothetical protein
MVGCSTFGSVKVEDINDLQVRLQQIALVVGPSKDLDVAIDLLNKANLALEMEDNVKAKEYRDAALILMDILEEK